MHYIPACCLLLLIAVHADELNDNFVLEYTVVRIRPKGYRISIVDQGQIQQIHYRVNINKPVTIETRGDFIAILKEPIDGQWILDNINVSVEPFSTIHFRLEIKLKHSAKIRTIIRRATVSEDSIDTLLSCPSPADMSSMTTKPPLICHPSLTTVGHKPVCKDQLIFYDDFSILNLTQWTTEVRMPFDAENAPFVSFQSQRENCYVTDNKLYIKPTLQSEAPGFDESKIRYASLNLENCTIAEGKSLECFRQARFSQILPPVISAKIHTKNSFNFRYGRVEIRAKLPQGDWLLPLILLEPVENYYGDRNYASGQIRIVYSQGNEFIRHRDHSTSNHMIFGGVIISDSQALREVTLKGPRFISSDFHTYTLNWTENHITIGVDRDIYGIVQGDLSQVYGNVKHANEWNKGNRMAPFDREFYLSLGVSVGGHSDFPDSIESKPWKNGDPKAMLTFWKDRGNWKRTWGTETSQLQVDYIKVFAL